VQVLLETETDAALRAVFEGSLAPRLTDSFDRIKHHSSCAASMVADIAPG
jgi:hypothetical protein